MRRGIAGVLPGVIEADAAVAELERVGFSPEDISVARRGARIERRLARKGGTVQRGAVAGGGAGAVIGAGVGLFAGIGILGGATWSLVLLTSAVGAALGGLVGGLMGEVLRALGWREPDTARRQGVLVLVRAEDHEGQARALEVFGRLGVKDVLMGAVV